MLVKVLKLQIHVNFKPDGGKLSPWVSYDKSTGKMYCEACIKTGKTVIRLSQIALTLPLQTASCERVLSQQNLILTKQRSRLAPATSDKLLRTRLASNAGVILNFFGLSPTLALAKKEANQNKIGNVKEYTINNVNIVFVLFSAYTGLLILTH